MWMAAESMGSSASTSYSCANPPLPTAALPPSDCAAMFAFLLLPSCETHSNRTVVVSRGARTPRHFPDTCCPLPSWSHQSRRPRVGGSASSWSGRDTATGRPPAAEAESLFVLVQQPCIIPSCERGHLGQLEAMT